MKRPNCRSLARLVVLCAPLLALESSPARATAAPSPRQREQIEPASKPAPGWLLRALRHRAGGLPPAPPTGDPHAGPMTVELVLTDAQPSAPRVELAGLIVEVLFVVSDPTAPSWTAVARVGADGKATFARVPEGRPHVLVFAPDSMRVPLVPDPALYGSLFEPFGGGQFPHLGLDDVPREGDERLVRLQLVPARLAEGFVELFGAPVSGLRPGDVPVERALAWVASPGWLQLVPIGADGAFLWREPRPTPDAPFDPAAPSAGFLERLTGGVARPFGSAGSDWRDCWGVPAPPVGHPFVIELALESSVRRASGAEAFDGAPTPENSARTTESPTAAAALERWRALRATPITTPLERDTLAPPGITREERAALAKALLEGQAPRDGVERFIAEACRWELDPAYSALPEWHTPHEEQYELLCLAREWSALGPGATEEAELALLDRAASVVWALVRELYHIVFSTEVPLQLWIDVVAPRYPRYAESLAAHDPGLRAPRRNTSRGSLPEKLEELDPEGVVAALRRRPSSTLGAELAPLVRAAPRDAAERVLAGFAALARDDARGPSVRAGAVDLLLALGERPAGDGPLLAELVLATLADEPSDVALTEAVLAALAPLAPSRALADARAALSALAGSVQSADGRSADAPPMGALLVLARLAPTELVQRAEVTPSLATFAAAALLLEGRDALDARGLPHAFLERLLR